MEYLWAMPNQHKDCIKLITFMTYIYTLYKEREIIIVVPANDELTTEKCTSGNMEIHAQQ